MPAVQDNLVSSFLHYWK